MSDSKSLPRDGERIAYKNRSGRGPGVIFLGGFNSAMTGTKGQALDAWAERSGHGFVRFDYFGHGESSGDFRAGTITRWRDDALAVLDRLTEGPQILVGSSMGGWLSLLVAAMWPVRVAGLVLIAPATDFTETLLWARYPQEVKQQILTAGEYLWPSQYDDKPYPITRGLIEDGRRHLLLGRDPIALSCPVRILQGMRDPDVPWVHSLALVEALAGKVTMTLVKDGDHRLSTPSDLRLLERTLDGLVTDQERRPGAERPD